MTTSNPSGRAPTYSFFSICVEACTLLIRQCRRPASKHTRADFACSVRRIGGDSLTKIRSPLLKKVLGASALTITPLPLPSLVVSLLHQRVKRAAAALRTKVG